MKRGWTVSAIEKYVLEEWVNKGYQPPVIFIDYLQLIPYEDTNATDNGKIIENILFHLKNMATKLKTPVMVISSNKPFSIPYFNADVLLRIQQANVEQGQFDRKKEIKNIEITVSEVKDDKICATIPMIFYEQFAYFVESDWKEEGKNKNGR